MNHRSANIKKRSATTTVELAVVASIALLFLFGILEYARYVHLRQIVGNAAREGSRYAVVRTGDGTTTSDVVQEVQRRLGGRGKELQNLTIEVLNVDPNTGTPIPASSWTESGFGQAIAVRITGEYKPILPDFLMTQQMLTIDITHMMSSEAN